MKKLLAITLSLVMVFALVPSLMLTASADDNVVVNLTKNVEYATLKAAVAATSANDELKLLADVETTTANNDAGSGKAYSLDLDGHTITVKSQRLCDVKGSDKTVSYQNGNIVFDRDSELSGMEVGFFVRETSTLNLTNINMSMTESCHYTNTSDSQYGLIGIIRSASDAQCNVNINGCNLTSKGTVIDFNTITKYNVTITDSTLTGVKTGGSAVFKGIEQTNTGTVTISNSTLNQSSDFVTDSLATVVVADGESVYDSTTNSRIDNIIIADRKLDPAVYVGYSALTFKVADPYEDIAGTTNEAAQLRIGNLNGIRFTTEIDTDLVAQAKAEGYTVTMGTLIAPLTAGTLTLDTNPVLDIPTTGWFANNVGEIAGSIVNIKEANFTKEFVARGYVTLTKGNESTTYYAVQPNEGRSLKAIAAACVADNSFFYMLNSAQQLQVIAWANA